MTFDPSKPCQTRSGHPVTIVATNWPGPQPILGRAADSYEPQLWSADGSFYTRGSLCPSSLDLINVPPKPKVGWVIMNIALPKVEPWVWDSIEEAQFHLPSDRTVTLTRIAKIEWEE